MTTLPHVTDIIRAAFPMPAIDPWYLGRGGMVHAATALALFNRLDWSTLDERIRGRVAAAVRFRDEVIDGGMAGIIACELDVANERDGYCGRCDLVCMIDGLPWVVDWKGGETGTEDLQCAAYAAAAHDVLATGPILRGRGVRTLDDGTYRVIGNYSDLRRPFREFTQGCLTIYNRKLRLGQVDVSERVTP